MRRKLSLFPRKAPKQERSQHVVGSIVAATIRIMDKLDFEKITTTKIAEIAGVSVGSLYQYFPTKESIYAEVMQAVADRNVKRITKKLGDAGALPVEEAIRIVIEHMVDLLVQDQRLLRAFFQKAAQIRGYETEVKLRAVLAGELEKILTARRDDLNLPDPRVQSYILVNALSGVLELYALETPDWINKPRLVDELTELVLGYIGKRR